MPHYQILTLFSTAVSLVLKLSESVCLPSLTCCSLSFQHLVNLFARLANDNIGYIDWDPYIPKVCWLPSLHQPLHNLALMYSEIWCMSARVWPIFAILAHGVYFMTNAACQRNKISGFLVDVGHWREVTCIMFVFFIWVTVKVLAIQQHQHMLLQINTNIRYWPVKPNWMSVVWCNCTTKKPTVK